MVQSVKMIVAGSIVLGLSAVAVMAQSSTGTTGIRGAELLPPNAKPGECYARVFVPPTYTTESEQMLSQEKTSRLEVVPATYEWVEQSVLVREASQKLEVVPPKYGIVTEKVLVKEAAKRMETVPARYEWIEEKTLVEAAHTVWKKGRGPIQKLDNSTGEIMCLVEVPAVYKTVRKRVEREPASTRTIEIPAEYKTIEKRVIVEPATTRTIEIPAEYSTVRVQKMVSAPQERRIEIPAEYQTVTRTSRVSEGSLEWRPVLCETNMTASTIRELQSALQRAGFNPGPIDGIFGSETMSAVQSYQQAKNLSTGGLTLETLNSLGVRL